MIFRELNDDNYMLFAIRHYENPHSVTKEDFLDDLKRFKYVKRLLKRFKKTGVLKSHLLVNHFIILFNIFGDATIPLLFYKIDKELWSTMKSFLIFLNRLPQTPKSYIHDIHVDLECFRLLQLEYNETQDSEQDT